MKNYEKLSKEELIKLLLEKEQNNSDWVKIPELKIEVEKEIHDKGKSWEELELVEKENQEKLLTKDEIIFLYNNKNYRELLGLRNTFEFIQKYIDNFPVARFDADSDGAGLNCSRDAEDSGDALGVRFKRKIIENDNNERQT